MTVSNVPGRSSRARVIAAALLAGASCAPMAPYTPLARGIRGEDPDAVYAAAVRVLERKGWGILFADRYLREVRTNWFPFRDIGLGAAGAGEYSGAWQVKIAGGRIQVFTACYRTGDSEPLHRVEMCPPDERPEGLRERELELAADILDEAHAPAAPVTAGVASSTPYDVPNEATQSPPPDAAAGCARDIECKGDRICQRGECTDPPESHSWSQ
jgi:hypothetical protein